MTTPPANAKSKPSPLPAISPRSEKAIASAEEATKQLLTLAVGVLTLTVTFAKEFLGENAVGALYPLVASWSLLLASVLFGVVTLQMMAGQLARASAPDSYAPGVRISAALQMISFVVGLYFTVRVGAVKAGVRPDVNFWVELLLAIVACVAVAALLPKLGGNARN